MLMKMSGLGVLLIALGHSTAAAQFEVLSSIRSGGSIDSVRAPSATAAHEDVLAVITQATNNVLLERGDYPTDSIEQLATTRAQQWMTRLQGITIRGSEMDAYAQVALAAHEDTRARQIFDARLKAPDLSPTDRTCTLFLAVTGFADPAVPARLPIAERYLEQLDAVGGSGWGFFRRVFAEDALLQAYDALGKPAEIVRHGKALIRLLPHLSLRELMLFNGTDGDFYIRIASVLAVQPNGRATLTTLDSLLLASARPPADSVALDTAAFLEASRGLVQGWKIKIAQAKRVGELAAPISSNYWINTADSSPHTLSVSDGKIRVIERGNRSCAPCLQAMSGLQHLQNLFPDIQVVLITATEGSWGNRVLPAEEESRYVKDFYVNQRQLHYPIALWLAPKKTEADGSTYPDLSGDSAEVHYPDAVGPLIYVVDGGGRIRYVRWSYVRGDEYKYLVNVIRHLQAEAAADKGTTSGVGAGSGGGRSS